MSQHKPMQWKTGFSNMLENWRLRNSAVPFSAESYRRIEAVNSQLNRTVMDRVFKRIEDACTKPHR